MDAPFKKITRIIRRHTTLRSRAAREYAKHVPSLVLGVLTTLLAMGFNYLVYDSRITLRASGNRVAGAADAAAPDAGGRRPAERVPTPMRIVTGAVSLADDIARDAMFAIRGPSPLPPTSDRIAVIAIDEDSLVRHASWPWPRTDIARLMEKAADAKVIGLDILFPDGDRMSLSHHLRRFNSIYGLSVGMDGVDPEEVDNDLRLAGRVSRTPTVLGVALFDGTPPTMRLENSKTAVRAAAVLPDGSPAGLDGVLLENSRYAITSIGRVRDTQPGPVGEGFMNLFPLPTGMVRNIPLLARVTNTALAARTGRVVPSLPLEVVRAHLGGDSYRVNLRGDTIRVPGEDGLLAVSGLSVMGGGRELLNIPLSEFADMEVSFRGARDAYTVYPAWEVLAGAHDGAFKDKIVLIGGTVAAVGYVVSVGQQDPEISVVTAHAAMIAAMLKGDFFRSSYRGDYFWRQACILAVGLIVTLATVFGDATVGAAAAAACAAGVLVCNYLFLFRRGLDVGVTVPVLSTGAIFAALLASNHLSVGRERRFIRKAFALNVSPSILGYLESHPDRLTSLQGEHRHMTVLFSDIRNFTAISERMAAPDLARFLNEYFTPMSDMVMRNTGTVDKFIGDGMMAFWNAPTDNPGHMRDAARAALDMAAKLAELQPDWTRRGLPRISIGCGINTGMMFAGYMGSEQRKNYTVMGDNVNIASRLESLNKVYSSSILVTESTRQGLGADFVCRVADKVRVSGKESPVVIYELLGAGPAGEEKAEELAAFARVFELYQQKEFATAESLLKELVFIRPAPLYKLYLDRLAIYKALPPPADWDGTFAKMSK